MPVRPRRRADLDCYELDGEAVLYDGIYDTACRLNGSAQVLWRACDGSRTVEDLAETLRAMYTVEADTALSDASEALERLWRDGLLVVDESS